MSDNSSTEHKDCPVKRHGVLLVDRLFGVFGRVLLRDASIEKPIYAEERAGLFQIGRHRHPDGKSQMEDQDSTPLPMCISCIQPETLTPLLASILEPFQDLPTQPRPTRSVDAKILDNRQRKVLLAGKLHTKLVTFTGDEILVSGRSDELGSAYIQLVNRPST